MRKRFRLLIDTCVWLDLARDHRQLALLDVLEGLIETGDVELILPRVVVEEFGRNEARVVDDAGRGIAATLKRTRELIDLLGDGRGKISALKQLDELGYRIPRVRESAIEALVRIEAIFDHSRKLATTPEALLAAAQRGLQGVAPFHRSKNSMADAVIFETYLQCLSAQDSVGLRFAFVTHNTKDFSDPAGDNREPHPDLDGHFTKVKSLYFTSLAAALQRMRPEAVTDAMVEREWHEEARGLWEILDALEELVERLWYGRHQRLASSVESGRVRVIERGEQVDPNEFPPPLYADIWDGAMKAARRVEKKHGPDGLGPWDDFEWGMLSGKVSALRWILGDDWDMLDT